MTAPNSLGFTKPPGKTRVVVAMSGGVDSSTTAALLAREGYDVVGLTLKLYEKAEDPGDDRGRSCCTGSDIGDAAAIATEYGFAHHVLDFQDLFARKVIDDFVSAYAQGRTPIPCTTCNAQVKFGDMLAAALDLGADCLATGHYVQTRTHNGVTELHRGADAAKDQSYFLFAVPPTALARARFPLGGWTKARTRAEAARLGLITAEKAESQDICFVPSGDYAEIVALRGGAAAAPGDIVDEAGRGLGQHRGIVHYTIGQRRGLGIGGGNDADGGAFYVVRIDAEANRVVVGPKAALARTVMTIEDCTWQEPGAMGPVLLQFRSSMAPVGAMLEQGPPGTARLTLPAPQYGVAPGQAAVCYAGTRVLGGGIIKAAA